MCFSADVDLVAGLVVSAIGIDALRHVRRPAEMPLAVLPLVLAGHQLVETFVWWGLEDRVPKAVWHPAVWLYLVIAFGVVPVLVPVAVGALEPVANRRQVGAFTVIGSGVAVVLMYAVERGPVAVSIQGHHIAYNVDLWQGDIIVALYILATCGSLLMSKRSHVRWFGATNLLAVCLLAWLSQSGFISLWCVWAAVASVAIAVHLRHASQPLGPPPSDPRTSSSQGASDS